MMSQHCGALLPFLGTTLALMLTFSPCSSITGIDGDDLLSFELSHYKAELLENGPAGLAVLQVQATGAHKGLTYTLDSFSQQDFSIDAHTGIIYTTGPIDREDLGTLEMYVTVKDEGPPVKTSAVTVTITIRDVNDNAPKFMLRGYSFSLPENLTPLSPVNTVTVIDADQGQNAQLHLFVKPDDGKFIIKKGTGLILSRFSLDRENESSHSFFLEAVDRGHPPLSSCVPIIVNVLDENDNAPYVTRPSNSSYTFLPLLSSPGTLVERVEAEDMDTGMNSELLYFIIGGNPHGLFHISRRTGEITLTREDANTRAFTDWWFMSATWANLHNIPPLWSMYL